MYIVAMTTNTAAPPRFGPLSTRWTSARIRDLRASLGLTQEQLARALGVTVSAVCRWETGLHIPSPMACRLLGALEAERERERAA